GTATFNTATAGAGKTVTLTGATLTGTAAGNYTLAPVGTATATIAKADATITGGYTGVYNGAAHTATGTATGVLGETLSGLVVSGTPHTNAGTYSDSWTFTDVTGNYNNASGTVSSSIAKADATVTVSGYSGVYNGAAHGPTGTALGLLSNASTIPIQPGGWLLDLSPTNGITNSALYGNNGYRMVNTVYPADQEAQVTLAGAPAAGSGHFTFISLRIQNPNTTSLNSYDIGYVGAGASGTWIVSRFINNNSLTVSLTSGTLLAAGDIIRATVVGNTITAYSYHGGVWKAEVSYTMTGADMVSGPGYMGVEISGNSPELRLTNMIGGGYTGVFGAAAHGAAGTAVGVLGESLSGLDLSGTTHTNAGTYTDPWTFTDSTGNYNNASGTVSDNIAKATATATVNGYTGIFDGTAHGATGTAVGVLGESLSAGLNLGATFTNIPGGTANWTFSGGTNYTDQSGSVAIVISNNVATTTSVSSSGTPSTYGTAVTFTATVTATAGSAAPTGTVEFFDGATSLGID
ncbi:MAG: YDG domain-containing protein, partial [Nitrospirota bacterium]